MQRYTRHEKNLRERLAARGADVRFLARVGPHVSLEGAGTRVRLAEDPTHVRLLDDDRW